MSFYLTTPIYYVNAEPHLGHAYTTIVTDVVCRYQRLLGEEVWLQTGTDEHGDKVVQAAKAAGMSPREYTDKISALFRETWPLLDIEADFFIRTTDQRHVEIVQRILTKVYEQGDIYFGEYSGRYCQGCERFLTEKELVEAKCPDHLVEPTQVSEKNYFFRMGKYQDWLIDYIQKHPEFITPERYRNEVLSFLKEPLEDLCISRPVSRLTWGIPLPFDPGFVTYVWFDALINYLSGIGYPDEPRFGKFWPAAEHCIAKDILKPHAVYWPTMLKSMGLEPFRKLHVHGYWRVGETKMSKSIGNVVRPRDLVQEYGSDAVRYFLLREMTFGLDASFGTETLRARKNSDLANDLGNLLSRSLTMLEKFADGRIPAPGPLSERDQELKEAALAMMVEYRTHMDAFAFNRAIQAVWEVISRANRYIVTNAPWELAKDPSAAEVLATVLYCLFEVLRLVTVALVPVMPAAAKKMQSLLGFEGPVDFHRAAQWGLLKPGTAMGKPVALFPRMEEKEREKVTAGVSDPVPPGSRLS